MYITEIILLKLSSRSIFFRKEMFSSGKRCNIRQSEIDTITPLATLREAELKMKPLVRNCRKTDNLTNLLLRPDREGK